MVKGPERFRGARAVSGEATRPVVAAKLSRGEADMAARTPLPGSSRSSDGGSGADEPRCRAEGRPTFSDAGVEVSMGAQAPVQIGPAKQGATAGVYAKPR